MTKEEMVEKIVSKSGVTREQAEEALEKNNNDLLDAMIYVERTYSTARKYGSPNYNNANAFNPQQPFQDFNCNKAAEEDIAFKKTVRALLDTLWKNRLAVSYKGAEVMSMPILIWLIFFVTSVSTLFLVMIISMFFDVRYYIKGVTFNSDKVNRFMDYVSGFVSRIKNSFTA